MTREIHRISAIEINEFIKKYEAERGVSPERIEAIQAEIDDRFERWFMACVIRDRRIDKNLSQGQLAEVANVSESLVRRIERGSDNPKLDTLQRIAWVLGLKVALVPA